MDDDRSRQRLYLLRPKKVFDLLAWFAEPEPRDRITATGLPPDARFAAGGHDWLRNVFWLRVWSATFDPVPENCEPPIGTLIFAVEPAYRVERADAPAAGPFVPHPAADLLRGEER
jgi:hypothetical protein